MVNKVENIITVINYIENNLTEKLNLSSIAMGVGYSKYHLHRMFVETVGLSIHDYVQRRQLTESAKLLVFSDKSILEISLIAGYESQQAFTNIFKQMYKKTPNEYRMNEEFYPLQLRFDLIQTVKQKLSQQEMEENIRFATTTDIPACLELAYLVIDGFPNLNENEFLTELKKGILEQRVLILTDNAIAIALMSINYHTGSIDFFGVHPLYRKYGITKMFLDKVMNELLIDKNISVTTFRKGDKADTGYRKAYKELGFAEAELLVEFGYPTQKLVLFSKNGGVVQMNSNPLAKDFNTGSLLKFAFPTISMMLFMGLYTIVDTIFVSRFVNTNALSAINIVCPVINLIVGLGTMIATGGSAIVARKMGAGEPKRAKQDFTLLILFGFILGVVIFILGIIFIDEIIYAIGADKILFPYCKDYLTIILLFTPASMLQVLFQNLFVTAGKPTLGLVLSVSAGVMNIVFDYLFMAIFGMGIAGAGLGTGIGYLIPAITGLIVFCKKSGTLSFVKPIIDIKVLGESCINGSSEMVSQLSTAITTFFFNRTMMNLLGVNGVASITIIIYTQFLLTTLFIGFSMGVAPVISYNFGANNYYGLKKIYKICISFIFVGSLFIFALSFINGNSLVRLFTGTNEAVYKIAINGFMIFVFSFLFSGFNIFSSAIFTALSNGKLSALISFLRTFGFIMIGLLVMPQFIEITGVWLAVPVAEILTLCISLYLNFRLWRSWNNQNNSYEKIQNWKIVG